jgi:hypothetical protein
VYRDNYSLEEYSGNFSIKVRNSVSFGIKEILQGIIGLIIRNTNYDVTREFSKIIERIYLFETQFRFLLFSKLYFPSIDNISWRLNFDKKNLKIDFPLSCPLRPHTLSPFYTCYCFHNKALQRTDSYA